MTLALFFNSSTTMSHSVTANGVATALIPPVGPGTTVDNVAVVNVTVAVNRNPAIDAYRRQHYFVKYCNRMVHPSDNLVWRSS